MISVARFARAFSALYSAGVGIPEAIRFSASATGNEFLSRRMRAAIPAIMLGQGIAESLQATRVFPPMMVSMLQTGERTGGMDTIMDKVAEYYEQESVVRLQQICVTLRTVLLMVAGIRVLMILIAFYGGYFSKMNDMANPDGP